MCQLREDPKGLTNCPENADVALTMGDCAGAGAAGIAGATAADGRAAGVVGASKNCPGYAVCSG